LTYNDLCARNDLQLMLLQRAWQAPWSPETHASYQPSFRVAVVTIAKSIHRLGFPHEIMLSICSFLQRDWWHDERRQCWNYACLSAKSMKMISHKMAPSYDDASPADDHPPMHFEYCRRCRVASYCGKSCKSRDLYVGHKARCCPALSKPPKDDEIQLYTKILVEKGSKSTLPTFLQYWAHLIHRKIEKTVTTEDTKTTGDNLVQVENNDDDDEKDDSSWETVDSSEGEEDGASIVDESKMSTTQLVRKYFDDKS
jgi:hypothetical protein